MKEKIKQLFTNKIGRRVIIGLGIFLTTLLLELFVFNYRAYINRGSSVDVSANNVICQNVKVVSSSSDGIVYEINSVDSPTFTIKFDEEKEIQTISAFIDFEHKDIYRYELNVEGSYDAGGSRYSSWSYRSLEYIKGLETSRYFEPGFNHPVDTIVLKFGTIDRVDSVVGQKFTLSKISFNYNIPFSFSAVRVFGLTIISEGVFLLTLLFVDRFKKNAVVEDKKVDIRKRVLNIIVYSLPIIGVILLFGFYGHFARAIALPNEGSQISKELVDAFLKGQVHLDIDVSKELAALSNPYDPEATIKSNAGLVLNRGLQVGACIVDEDYQGEVHLHVRNIGLDVQFLEPGEKLVQAILVPVLIEDVEVVDHISDLFEEETERGEGGFGSTGTK